MFPSKPLFRPLKTARKPKRPVFRPLKTARKPKRPANKGFHLKTS